MKRNIRLKNPILYRLGVLHLLVFLLLCLYFPFNNTVVLGLNSVIKPMKFALSIWIYSWTMAWILSYFEDTKKVKIYSWAAVVCMSFEQFAITLQAYRGEISHFNKANLLGIVLYAFMGIFILAITLWTAYMACVFMRQKTYSLPPALVLAIKIGLVYFVIFSLFGGYISSLKEHTVGGEDGGEGLPFLNWSTTFGDLRVAHFMGIHALQIIPIFSIILLKYKKISSKNGVLLFSSVYLLYVFFTMIQGFKGHPFICF